VPGDTGRGSEGRPNAGFVVTDSGVLVVDALGSPEEGERLLRTIAGVTEQPVRWLVLTHHHPDHHFGAVALRRAGARVIAHPNRATLAAENGDSAFVAAWTEVVGKRAMRGFAFADVPDVPITGDTTLRLGGREIALLQPGAAHTPGDLLVWLPAERILLAGDLLIEDGVTIVVDGDSRALLAALDRMDSLDARLAVPGHGRIEHDPAALIARTRCYVGGLRDAMRAAVARGESMNRVLARMPPADRTRPVSRASRERRNAVRVYLEMERELMQLDGGDAGDPSAGGSGPAAGAASSPAPPCAAAEVKPGLKPEVKPHGER
jgi:glyoxylase-like metal-dependent hydrolase (beta-lactamase superfamily II)